MNASQRLLEYIKNPVGHFAYFDIDIDYLRFAAKKETVDPIKDLMAFCESISNPCNIGFGDITRYIPQLKPIEQITGEDNNSRTKEIFFNTPLGKKGWVLRLMKNSATEKLSEATSVPVRTKDDFVLFDWFYETVKDADWSTCIKDIKGTLATIKDRVLASIFLVPPYELLYWTRRDEMFLLEFDYPQEYKDAMDKIIAAYDIILGVAKDAGIQIVAYGAPGGTEFTSPAIWRDSIVPTSAKLQELIVSHGLYSTYHCCGKVSTLIPKGFFNDINPNILETLSPPPVGDVTTLKEVRKILNKNIITHGNIDLTFLRDSTSAEVKKLAMDIMEQTTGFPHIVGAADGCLWPGTPPTNLKVVCELFN